MAAQRIWPWLLFAALLGLGLRGWEAAESSLWLDELHTLHHASQPDLAAVVESVRRDVHTPFFFGFVHLFGGWESGVGLRAIPALSSLLVLIPLLTLGRGLNLSSVGVLLAAWLYAALPYQVAYGSELRPYCWVGLFSAALVSVAFSERGSVSARLVLFFLFVLLGMWVHRLMAVTVAAVGLSRLVVSRPKMIRLPGMIAAGVLGVAGFLPWLFGFAQRATVARVEHAAAAGEHWIRPALLKEILFLPARLVSPYGGFLDGAWEQIAKWGMGFFGLGVLAAVLLSARSLARRCGPPRQSLLVGLVVFFIASFSLTAGLAIYRWDTVPLQYFTAAAWTLPLFVAAFTDAVEPERWKRPLAVGLAVLSLAMGVALAGGTSREDVRRATRVAVELGAELDHPIYTALLRQPPSFPNVTPYRAYAPNLEPVEPVDLPRPGDPDFDRPVIVIDRAVGDGRPEWGPIRTGRTITRRVSIDWFLKVIVFEPEVSRTR
jgi:uncharacterized membrane protein